ncbi:hypothetical protein [Curtobacterium sp. 20TX0008]|uniref:hypothetical protein n=1 Tax=Curtobacterium sp. 20TX0008 TaxID=3022018 RepID=UPI00232CB6EC|nr:hypothetical protein [Curtobacterium sp. 20TX0008]MDB6425856.1 hypothetical protein [Curtobacterium sp. 20TX0008]
MRWSKAVRATVAEEPRFWLPIAFLLVGVALLIVALLSLRDSGTAFGWGGFSSGFLTAGLVDLFGLLESRRRRLDVDRRLAPVQRVIVQHLQLQRRDLLESVSVLFDLDGDPPSWLERLRNDEVDMVPHEPAPIFPPQNRGARAFVLLTEAQERQARLEALSAHGLLTEQVAALAELVDRGQWRAVVSALYATPGLPMTGAGPSAAQVVEALIALEIPVD